MNGGGDGEGGKGMLWKLPAVKSKHLGKLGPAFGFGAGCGVGFGLGLMGGTQFSVFFSRNPHSMLIRFPVYGKRNRIYDSY